MKMQQLSGRWVADVSLLIGFLCMMIALVVHAQERPTNDQLKSWMLHKGKLEEGITVFDTGGICLYVYREFEFNRQFGSGIAIGQSNGVGMVAVPKSQLKPGYGCQ